MIKLPFWSSRAAQRNPETTSEDLGVVLDRSEASKGDAARSKGDWQSCIRHYTLHTNMYPDDAPILVQLGHALKEDGQLASAEMAYSRAIALIPKDSDLHLQLGHLAKLAGREQKMIASYSQAFHLDPSCQDAYREMLAYAPRTANGWINATTEPFSYVSGHELLQPVEPCITVSSSHCDDLVDDPLRAALDTIKVARTIRKTPDEVCFSATDFNYCVSKIGVFNSTYREASQVLANLAGTRGRRLDNGVEPDLLFMLGSVPARRLPRHLPTQPNALLQRYLNAQITATQRFILRPDLQKTADTGPLVSILLPVYRGPAVYIERAILSVLMQTYRNIQLCIVDDGSSWQDITALLNFYAAQDDRISLLVHTDNRGIAEATNSALGVAKGAYIALLDHDDMLAHDAIAIIAKRIQETDADLIYTDECKIDENDMASEMLVKPDWSPSLLLAVMYTGHLSVYKKALVEKVGGFRSQFDFSQDYDLALRIAEQSIKVDHIRQCLYGWRMVAGSAAQGGKPMARLSNVAALQDASDRRGLPGHAVGLPLSNRLSLRLPKPLPLVSVIVPSDNISNIITTISSLQLMTSYPNLEIIVVTNSGCVAQLEKQFRSKTVRSIAYDKDYNFSDKCNVGAQASKGKHLVFFNDDVRIIHADWLDALLDTIEMPGVGIVGPKLLYENGGIQHGGMVTGVRKFIGTAFHSFPDMTTAHFCFAQSTREVSVICGACLAIRADVFEQVGGFDAKNTPIAHSDVDLCFKVREAGYSCVYNPHSKLTHIGHLSIGAEKKKQKVKVVSKADIFLLRRWAEYCAYDPYFTPEMRDILYIDSMEQFDLHVGKRTAYKGGRDIMMISHDLSGSGAPRLAVDIVENLIRKGDYVLVVSPEDGPYRQDLIAMGADVLIDPLCLTDNKDFFELAFNFDAIIANTIVTWPAINQLAAVVKTFWYVHEVDLIGHLARANPTLGAQAHLATVWAASERARDALREIDIESIVLPGGVNSSPKGLTSNRAQDSKVIILVLGTFEPRKGQDLALLAMQSLPSDLASRCELRMAGRINDKSFFDAVMSMDSSSLINYAGELSAKDAAIAIQESDIIFCPSRDDTLPLVSLDALASGKVLICSKAVGTSSYIEHGISGYIASFPDVDQLTAALEIALRNEKNWSAIGRSARIIYEQNFTKTTFLERVDQQLKSVINSATFHI